LDVSNLGAIEGNAFYDPRHKFLSTFVYDLPFGRGKQFAGSLSRGADMLIGGWTISGITLIHSGLWLTPYFPSSLSDPSGTAPQSRSLANHPPHSAPVQTHTLSDPPLLTSF